MSSSPADSPAHKPPPNHTEKDRCFLLGPTALIVQAIMGVVVISSLIVKRQLEKRKRRWRVWVLDVGKQMAGQAVIHALNLLISQLVASAGQQNPCSLYFLNILIDTTIAIIWFSLKWYTSLFAQHYGQEMYTTGHYGHPPQWRIWAHQVQPYLLAAVTMKLVVLIPLTLPGISDHLISFAHNILSVLSLDAQVVFVLAVFPTIMNVFQFCVVDQLIKAGKGAEQKIEHDSDYDLDDEEEGTRMYRPLATEEFSNGNGTGHELAVAGNNSNAPAFSPSPRRRASSMQAGSKPLLSRTSSFANIASSRPTSPLLMAEDAHLPNRAGSLGLSGIGEETGRSAFNNFTSRSDGPPSNTSGASRTRRSDAPSPDDGTVLFFADPDLTTPVESPASLSPRG